MMRCRLGMVAAVLLAGANAAYAQDSNCAFGVCINSNRPDDSVASTGARTPGRMVNEGVARTLLNTQAAQSRIEITEPAGPDINEELRLEALDIIFEQVQELFIYFGSLLLERAGLDPLPPVDDGGGRPDKPGGR